MPTTSIVHLRASERVYMWAQSHAGAHVCLPKPASITISIIFFAVLIILEDIFDSPSIKTARAQSWKDRLTPSNSPPL
jgi:hypothetical protein